MQSPIKGRSCIDIKEKSHRHSDFSNPTHLSLTIYAGLSSFV